MRRFALGFLIAAGCGPSPCASFPEEACPDAVEVTPESCQELRRPCTHQDDDAIEAIAACWDEFGLIECDSQGNDVAQFLLSGACLMCAAQDMTPECAASWSSLVSGESTLFGADTCVLVDYFRANPDAWAARGAALDRRYPDGAERARGTR